MIIAADIQKITVKNEKTGEIIATIGNEEITTNGDEIVVVITPVYD